MSVIGVVMKVPDMLFRYLLVRIVYHLGNLVLAGMGSDTGERRPILCREPLCAAFVTLAATHRFTVMSDTSRIGHVEGWHLVQR